MKKTNIKNEENWLYHVSLEEIVKFLLRVPKFRIEGEDPITKRICFSETLEGAFSAMPHGSKVLAGALKLKYQSGISPIFHVYMIKKSDIDKSMLIESKELFVSKKVIDAELTKEVWILTENIRPIHKIVEVFDFVEKQSLLLEKNVVNVVSRVDCNWFDYPPSKTEKVDKHIQKSLGFWKSFQNKYKELYNKELSIETICSFLSSY